jgi:hypothetical protein
MHMHTDHDRALRGIATRIAARSPEMLADWISVENLLRQHYGLGPRLHVVPLGASPTHRSAGAAALTVET